MQKHLVIIIFLGLLNCKERKDSAEPSVSNGGHIEIAAMDLDWLLGKWERTNEEKGKRTFEFWEKETNGGYKGIGFTMMKGDTLKQERIKIMALNKVWVMSVKVPEEKHQVLFKITDHGNLSFRCENKTLDFQNTIRYWKQDAKLYAEVANTDMVIPFEFKKIAP